MTDVVYAAIATGDDPEIVTKTIETVDGVELVPEGAEAAGVSAVVGFALVVGGVAALVAVATDVWQSWQGGMVIDRTKNPAEISRDKNVFPNTIIILTADGTVEIENVEPKSSVAERILNKVLGLTVGATVDQIKAIAAESGATATDG